MKGMERAELNLAGTPPCSSRPFADLSGKGVAVAGGGTELFSASELCLLSPYSWGHEGGDRTRPGCES